MQTVDLHRKLQQATKQWEYGEYISLVYISGLLAVKSEVILTHLAVLHDMCFIEYSKHSNEMVRLTVTGKLANLEDYSGISNAFEKVIKNTRKESEENFHSLPFLFFQVGIN